MRAAVTEAIFLDRSLGMHEAGLLALRIGQTVRAAVAVGRIDLAGLEQERFVDGVKEVDAAHAHGPDRVAVIRLGERNKTGLSLVFRPFLLPVLKGDLERDLHGRGPAVGIEYFGQSAAVRLQ